MTWHRAADDVGFWRISELDHLVQRSVRLMTGLKRRFQQIVANAMTRERGAA